MNKIKILHCSDIHLGSKFRGLDDFKSSQRNIEIKNTFIETLNICHEEGVDVLLIAGDFFDSIYIDNITVNEIKHCMSKYKFKIVISPGNHDPFTSDSPYNSKWPDNVYIFKSNNVKYFHFEDINTRIFGNAFTNTYLKGENINFEKDLARENSDTLDIGIFHAEVISAEKENLYSPVTIEKIRSSRLDYIAFGHVHKRTPVQVIGKTSYSYCGCLEGRGFDETGDKGFYIGYISKGFVDLEFRTVCKRKYLDCTVNIGNCLNSLEACEKINSKLKESFGEDFNRHFYRVTLIGEISDEYLLDVKDIEAKMNSVFYIRVIDKTEPFLDLRSINLGTDLKSIFIKKMMSRIEGSVSAEEKIIENQALKIGLKAFMGEVKYSDN